MDETHVIICQKESGEDNQREKLNKRNKREEREKITNEVVCEMPQEKIFTKKKNSIIPRYKF